MSHLTLHAQTLNANSNTLRTVFLIKGKPLYWATAATSRNLPQTFTKKEVTNFTWIPSAYEWMYNNKDELNGLPDFCLQISVAFPPQFHPMLIVCFEFFYHEDMEFLCT